MHDGLIYVDGGCVDLGEFAPFPPAISAPAVLPRSPSLATIQSLQMALADAPQVNIPVEHFFADSLYARKMTMQAGEVVIGKLHKSKHFGVLLTGVVDVWEPGCAKKRITAPAFLTTTPGTKRVIHALTQTEWITFHGTEHTDPALIEADIIEPETHLLTGDAT